MGEKVESRMSPKFMFEQQGREWHLSELGQVEEKRVWG